MFKKIFFFYLMLSTGCTHNLIASSAKPQAQVIPEHHLPKKGKLPQTVLPLSYHLLLEIDPDKQSFSGRSRIAVQVKEPLQHVFLHAEDLNITSVLFITEKQRDRHVAFEILQKEHMVRVDLPYIYQGTATLVFDYHTALDDRLDGIYKVRSNQVSYVFSQFEPIAARKSFVCFDEPRFKTPFDVVLVIPKDDLAISNMPILGEQINSDDPTHKTVTFQTSPPLPTYLLAMMVGPFETLHAASHLSTLDLQRPIPIGGAATKGKGLLLYSALKDSQHLLSTLEEYFELPYPFSKLDLIAVPDFAAGAMENPGAITFRDWMLLIDPHHTSVMQRFDSRVVIAHELVHQWFGDLVTMPWWDDLWLNESFATWLSYPTVSETDSDYPTSMISQSIAHHSMRLDSFVSSRKIRQPIDSTDDIVNAFDGITYSKGASILRMYENYLGKENFRQAIQKHLKKYAFANADADDFLTSLSTSTGKDIRSSFKSFLDQPGVPLVQVDVLCEAKDKQLVLSQSRYRPLGSTIDSNSQWQIPFCFKSADANGNVEEQCTLLKDQQMAIPLTSCPKWLLPNSGGKGYYRFQQPLNSLKKQLAAPLATEEKLAVLDSLIASYHNAEISTSQLLPLLISQIGSEDSYLNLWPLGVFDQIRDHLLEAKDIEVFDAWIKKLYRHKIQKLSLKVTNPNRVDENMLRIQLLHFLIKIHDNSIVVPMAKLGIAYLGYNTDHHIHNDVVDDDLIEAALLAATQIHGKEVTAYLLELLQKSDDASLRRQLVNVLSVVSDKDSRDLIHPCLLNDSLRRNEIFPMLVRGISKADLKEEIWQWFQENYQQIKEKLPPHFLPSLPRIGAHFCSLEKRQELEHFFQNDLTHIEGIQRVLKQTLEEIDLCVALAEQQKPSADLFIRSLQ